MFKMLQVPSIEMVKFEYCSVEAKGNNLKEPTDKIYEKFVPVK